MFPDFYNLPFASPLSRGWGWPYSEVGDIRCAIVASIMPFLVAFVRMKMLQRFAFIFRRLEELFVSRLRNK
jgi:hypothetical protein